MQDLRRWQPQFCNFDRPDPVVPCKLAYSVMDKPQRQSPAADGKTVNAQVDKAMARRNTGHKPAPDHPWRKMSVGKSAHDGQRAAP